MAANSSVELMESWIVRRLAVGSIDWLDGWGDFITRVPRRIIKRKAPDKTPTSLESFFAEVRLSPRELSLFAGQNVRRPILLLPSNRKMIHLISEIEEWEEIAVELVQPNTMPQRIQLQRSINDSHASIEHRLSNCRDPLAVARDDHIWQRHTI